MKVVEKLVPLQTILDGDDLAGLWIPDKIQRQAAHGTLRAVISAIEDTLGRPFDDFCLPDELNIRPAVAGEENTFSETQGRRFGSTMSWVVICHCYPKMFSHSMSARSTTSLTDPILYRRGWNFFKTKVFWSFGRGARATACEMPLSGLQRGVPKAAYGRAFCNCRSLTISIMAHSNRARGAASRRTS